MAERATLARPYARAAFAQAQTGGALGVWSEMLANATAVVSDPRVKQLLLDPKVRNQQRIDFLAEMLGTKLTEQGRNFLQMLAENRRLVLLPEIATMFETLRAEAEHTADVQVTSAVVLSDAQRQRLAAALNKRLKREVRLHCDVDPTLIGGAIIRAGDMVIDGSLKAQLDRLAAAATH